MFDKNFGQWYSEIAFSESIQYNYALFSPCPKRKVVDPDLLGKSFTSNASYFAMSTNEHYYIRLAQA